MIVASTDWVVRGGDKLKGPRQDQAESVQRTAWPREHHEQNEMNFSV